MKISSLVFLAPIFLIYVGCSEGPAPIISSDPRLQASGEFLSLTQSTSASSLSSNVNPSLRLIVTVQSPTISGHTLQATDIHFVGSRAYVSYNVAGETQMGAIDVVNFTKVTEPKIDSTLELPNHDANAIYRHGDQVYVVGAVDSGGAAILKVPYRGHTLDSNFSSYSLESFAGTDVSVLESKIYVTSGDSGGLEIFDSESMGRLVYSPIADARGISLARDSKILSIISGQPGTLYQATQEGELSQTFDVGGNSIAESKSTVESGKTTTAVSLGDKGWKILCTENGRELAHIPAISLAGIDPASTVTNAVSSDDGLVFAANGQAGVYVYETKESSAVSGTHCKNLKVSLLGSINFGNSISANHVLYKKGFLFVPAGLGGVKVVQISRKKVQDDFDDFDDSDGKEDKDESDD